MTRSSSGSDLAREAVPDTTPAAGGRSGGRRRWLRPTGIATGIMTAVAIVGAIVAASREPESHKGPAPAERPGAEEASRRFVSGVSALHAAFVREGPWEGAFTEHDINCWLATDLPRNHRNLLPAGVTEPRIDLQPRRVAIAARLPLAGLRPVVTIVLGVRLREPNQLGVTVEQARLGAIPLPGGPVLAELRRRFDGLGMVSSIRRLDDRSVLVVYIPSTHESGGRSHWLESLSIADGSVAVAGRTLRRRDDDEP